MKSEKLLEHLEKKVCQKAEFRCGGLQQADLAIQEFSAGTVTGGSTRLIALHSRGDQRRAAFYEETVPMDFDFSPQEMKSLITDFHCPVSFIGTRKAVSGIGSLSKHNSKVGGLSLGLTGYNIFFPRAFSTFLTKDCNTVAATFSYDAQNAASRGVIEGLSSKDFQQHFNENEISNGLQHPIQWMVQLLSLSVFYIQRDCVMWSTQISLIEKNPGVEQTQIMFQLTSGGRYTKIHKLDIDLETLECYDLRWKFDSMNHDYIILQEIDQREADILFAHTKDIRKQRTLEKFARQPENEYNLDDIPDFGTSGDAQDAIISERNSITHAFSEHDTRRYQEESRFPKTTSQGKWKKFWTRVSGSASHDRRDPLHKTTVRRPDADFEDVVVDDLQENAFHDFERSDQSHRGSKIDLKAGNEYKTNSFPLLPTSNNATSQARAAKLFESRSYLALREQKLISEHHTKHITSSLSDNRVNLASAHHEDPSLGSTPPGTQDSSESWTRRRVSTDFHQYLESASQRHPRSASKSSISNEARVSHFHTRITAPKETQSPTKRASDIKDVNVVLLFLKRQARFSQRLSKFLVREIESLNSSTVLNVHSEFDFKHFCNLLTERLANVDNQLDCIIEQLTCMQHRLDAHTTWKNNLRSEEGNLRALENSRIQSELAAASRQDSSQMKSIAIVTMVFLPGTFMSTLFSMGIFSWNNDIGHIVGPNFWIYWAISVPLTLIVLLLWDVFTKYRKDSEANREIVDKLSKRKLSIDKVTKEHLTLIQLFQGNIFSRSVKFMIHHYGLGVGLPASPSQWAVWVLTMDLFRWMHPRVSSALCIDPQAVKRKGYTEIDNSDTISTVDIRDVWSANKRNGLGRGLYNRGVFVKDHGSYRTLLARQKQRYRKSTKGPAEASSPDHSSSSKTSKRRNKPLSTRIRSMLGRTKQRDEERASIATNTNIANSSQSDHESDSQGVNGFQGTQKDTQDTESQLVLSRPELEHPGKNGPVEHANYWQHHAISDHGTLPEQVHEDDQENIAGEGPSRSGAFRDLGLDPGSKHSSREGMSDAVWEFNSLDIEYSEPGSSV